MFVAKIETQEEKFTKKLKKLRVNGLEALTGKGTWILWILFNEHDLELNSETANKVIQFHKSEIGKYNKDDFLVLEKMAYTSDFIGIYK